MKCKNPNCERKTFTKSGYCSRTCADYHNAILHGKISNEKDLDKIQAQTIHLPNGIDIRNDAMGKEIAGYLNTSYVGRKK
jgi:hypothetical protein